VNAQVVGATAGTEPTAVLADVNRRAFGRDPREQADADVRDPDAAVGAGAAQRVGQVGAVAPVQCDLTGPPP
jgi:hypothetical protein